MGDANCHVWLLGGHEADLVAMILCQVHRDHYMRG